LATKTFSFLFIKRVPVTHCRRSFGTQLERTSGLKNLLIRAIADLQNSSPKNAAVPTSLYKNAPLVINKQDYAKAKKHSTMGETLGVAREMQARRTLLTQFSQRYSKSDFNIKKGSR
jgi:ribonuclease Z